MDERRKNEAINSMLNIEFAPDTDISEYEKDTENRGIKLPLSEISTLGVAFASMPASVRTITSTTTQATKGLYRCRFPNGVSGTLAQKGSENLGAIMQKGHGVVGQARWTPVNYVSSTTSTVAAFNPTMIFMAVALMDIEKKLSSIQETQEELLELFKAEKRAELKGDLNFLLEIMSNYKFNWENDKYKSAQHIKVLDIKQSSDQSISLYHDLISDILNKVNSKQLLIDSKDIKQKLKKAKENFNSYQQAVYLYGFASFLDIMLLENFNAGYLHNIIDEIEKRSNEYIELYTSCYNLIDSQLDSSVQSLLLNGMGSINKTFGKAAENLPLADKMQLDEMLLSTGSKIESFNFSNKEKALNRLNSNKGTYIDTFVESINNICELYNRPVDICFDNDNIYYMPLEKIARACEAFSVN